MAEPEFGTFFVPGPTEIRPEILEQLTRPMMVHRGREFEAMFARIEAGLRDVLLTSRPVYVGATSATGFMEMAIRNVREGAILSRQRRILRALRRSCRVVRARGRSRDGALG